MGKPKKTKMNDSNKVALICHDSGGAEIISSWAKTYKNPFITCLSGPAVNIFTRKFDKFKNQKLEKAITDSDWVLTGTSTHSDVENKAISIAKKSKKKVVTFLDHWKNYKKRFLYQGKELLPDEIYVGDEYAQNLAEKIFSSTPIKLINNPYWQSLKKEFFEKNSPAEKRNSVLYLSSNFDYEEKIQLSENSKDFYILNLFLDKYKNILPHKDIKSILISPHPSESKEKYARYKKFPLVDINEEKGLVELIQSSEFIVGCDNMALVVSKLSGKKTINICSKYQKCNIPENFIDKNICIENI